MILKDRKGRRLYPVCRFEENQHKIYTMYERALIVRDAAWESGTGIDTAEENARKMEEALEWIDNVYADGIVYAPYPIYEFLKEIIAAYDIQHDMIERS